MGESSQKLELGVSLEGWKRLWRVGGGKQIGRQNCGNRGFRLNDNLFWRKIPSYNLLLP